ncbi:MAG: hypothetical protein J6L72_07265 [Butyricicoccus sp.]|nr:hypothetical protein [Butyricicoccus sp.]
MNHEINLTGYTATCGETNNMLDLGTAGSYGLEKLHVTADAAWEGLTITATFTNSGSTTVPVKNGAVDVPPEATRLPTRDRVRNGMLAFKGVDAQGKLRIISTPIYYKVQASAATDGSNTIDPTPDQYAQFVAEVMAEADRAEAAANRAESAGGNVTPEQIAAAVNDYLTENPVQTTPIDATLTQSGQAADAAAVGDRLSALSEEIANIPSGADGKSAYQYAVEGGYTGTETEFAAKLAKEIPETLPNPNALTFTGAVTGSYDGSVPVSVKIPEGGSGEAWELIDSVTLSEDVTSVNFNFDTPYKKILFMCQPNVSVSGWKHFSINNGTGIPCANVAISSTHALFIEIGASEKRRYQAKDNRVFARVRMTIEQIYRPENGTLDTYDGNLWVDIAGAYFGYKSEMEINSIAMNTATMCVAGAYFEVWGVKA